MAFNGLVAGECGGANPLMKLTDQVHSQKLKERNYDQYQRSKGHAQGAVGIPQTFDMQCLLDEMQDLQRPIGLSNTNHIHKTAKNWQVEFARQNREMQHSAEVSSVIDRQVEKHVLPVVASPAPIQPIYRPSLHQQRFLRSPQAMNNQNWAHGFLDKSMTELNKEESVEKTGKEILESLEARDEEDVAKKWVEEMKTTEEMKPKEKEEEYTDDYLNSIPDVTDSDFKYWEKLQEDFNELFHQEHLTSDGALDTIFNDNHSLKEYSFEESNPFAGKANAFEEGLKKLEAGDLISAILLFEEAVAQKPDHAEAWQYLGTSQAENEQEMLSIKALKKCVALQPDNLEAWMSLSVSYTNESMYSEACESLRSWVENNPKYQHLLSIPSASKKSSDLFKSSLVSSESLKEIENLYLSAARISPGLVDADIQIGLGILFNISHEYDKAIDCFQTGLKINPKSANLWNKLGATLANSGRSAEAIEAYRNALSLRPGFIRCRYNLGISCINLKVYGTAIEHFLTALNMQRQGEDPTRTASTMSENIWDTLRMTMSLHGRLNLLPSVEARDLKRLNKEFQENTPFS